MMESKKLLADLPRLEKSFAYALSETSPPTKKRHALRHLAFYVLAILLIATMVWAILATEYFQELRMEHDELSSNYAALQSRWEKSEQDRIMKEREIALWKQQIAFQEKRIREIELRLKRRMKDLLAAKRQTADAEEKLAAEIARHEELRRRFIRYQSVKMREYAQAPVLEPPVTANHQTQDFPRGEIELGPVRGKVVKVIAANEYAIVNIGQNEGIKEGDLFRVVRDGVPLDTQLRVERIYSRISSCQILPGSADFVQADDQVIG